MNAPHDTGRWLAPRTATDLGFRKTSKAESVFVVIVVQLYTHTPPHTTIPCAQEIISVVMGRHFRAKTRKKS